jgi:hypothetical protein
MRSTCGCRVRAGPRMLEVAATSVLSRLAHHAARPVRGEAPTPPPLVSNVRFYRGIHDESYCGTNSISTSTSDSTFATL